jgi:hypothetical protein
MSYTHDAMGIDPEKSSKLQEAAAAAAGRGYLNKRPLDWAGEFFDKEGALDPAQLLRGREFEC